MNESIQETGLVENGLDAEVVHFILDLVRKCYARRKIFQNTRNDSLPLFCPLTFDGYSCWDPTPAGQTAHLPCPSFVTGFDPRRVAFKRCLENGSWFQHPESGRDWSNYTTCVDIEDLSFRQLVNNLYVCGYSISVITLVLSLAIFLTFRSLRCTRICIHIHLFVSIIINNVLWLVWYLCVVERPQVVAANESWCQLLHISAHYFMVSNYMWMFCEGLHLHLALVVVFLKDKVVMKVFFGIGWGLPLLLTIIYSSVRYSRPKESNRCWMNDSSTMWILTGPVFVSMMTSVVFLVNAVRVLITKMNRESVPVGLRKAVRATLILVPLFGLQHILLPFRPEPGAAGEQFYQVFSSIVVSLQGLCVSSLFCFGNMDVHSAIRRRLAGLGAGWEIWASMRGDQDGHTQLHTHTHVQGQFRDIRDTFV